MEAIPPQATRPCNDDQMRIVIEFCDQFRETVFAKLPEFEDPRDAFSMAMVAGVTFAGMQAGHLITMGDYVESPALEDQLILMLATNFSFGVRLGKRHAVDQLAKLGGGLN